MAAEATVEATEAEEVATEAEEVALAAGMPTALLKVGATAADDAAAAPKMFPMAKNLWVTRERALGKGLGKRPGGEPRTVGSSAAPKA